MLDDRTGLPCADIRGDDKGERKKKDEGREGGGGRAATTNEALISWYGRA